MLVERETLHRVLEILVQIGQRTFSGQHADHVRLIGNGRRLRLTIVDTTVRVDASIPAEGEIAVCLPATALLEFIRPLDEEDQSGVVELIQTDALHVDVACECALTSFDTFPIADFLTSRACLFATRGL